MPKHSPTAAATLCLGIAAVTLLPLSQIPAQASSSPQTAAPDASVPRQIAIHLQVGAEAYAAKQYRRSAEHYGKALDLGHDDPSIAYNAACCASLSDQHKLAFAFLDTAIELGWTNTRLLQRDSDLGSLHGADQWATVVTRTKAAENSVKVRWQSPAFQTPFNKNLSDSEKAAGVAKLWSEVKYNFVHFDQVPDLDWDATYMETLPRALATESTFAFYQELKRMVAKLEDAHTNVYLPSQLSKMECEPGIATQLLEDKVIVVQVYDRSAASDGLEVGMEILKVDGLGVKEHATKSVAPFLCVSTEQDRLSRMYGRDLLRGPLKQAIKLTVRAANGTESDIEIGRQSKMAANIRRFSQSAFRFEVLDGNVGHLQLNTFATDAVTKKFLANLEKIHATDALVIDLRKNGGGNSRIGWDILTHLTNRPFDITRWHTLQYRPTARAWGKQPMTRYSRSSTPYRRSNKKIYDKPVVMLIGPRTFSAAEDMAAVFDQLDRGKLIGQATGGSTGQPLNFDLPGGGKARVCTKHDFYADGTEFVGFGIQPDVAVNETITDVRAGVDGVLQAAIQELKSERK